MSTYQQKACKIDALQFGRNFYDRRDATHVIFFINFFSFGRKNKYLVFERFAALSNNWPSPKQGK